MREGFEKKYGCGTEVNKRAEMALWKPMNMKISFYNHNRVERIKDIATIHLMKH